MPKLTRNSNRLATPVTSNLEKRLSVYVAAASAAAGIAALALATPAEAKVVYTPANQSLTFNGQVSLDLNGDGIADVAFIGSHSNNPYSDWILASPAAGNAIVGAVSSAAALPWGARVGPNDQFNTRSEIMVRADCKTNCTTNGPWADKYNRFLGVRFVISGETHYGWVNINMNKRVITGYAYESIPNKPLIAGVESGPAKLSAAILEPSHQPATLAALARGADAMPLWRREEENRN